MGPILVPLDESRIAEQALPWAVAIARACGWPVHLVSVQPGPEAFWEFVDVDPREPIGAHRETLRAYLNQLTHLDLVRGVTLTAEVLDGEVTERLTWLVDRTNAALVTITTRGRSGFRAASTGSTADRLVRTLKVPVLVVPPDVDLMPIEAIVVPLDGSSAAACAVRPARELAEAMGAQLHLLRAVDPDMAWGLPEPEGEQYLAAVRAGAVRQLADVAGPGEVTAVRDGRPSDAILDYAGEQGCRLIVMTTHGRTGSARRELGSVADDVVRATNRPVLLLRTGPAATAA